MTQAILHLHSQYTIDRVDDRIFGGFIEHLGRCVYQGVYEPDHPLSDSNGLRSDVKEALDDMGVTTVRYPGGNFVSGYHWEDGVGPADSRPAVKELAWQSKESNRFGTDEFLTLCQSMNWQPMLAVNLGTGTPEEARNWVEYCNGEPGTRHADRRVANGHSAPRKVPLWCLGNEMDGPWQLGHAPVGEYCNRARMAGKMMKDFDPGIELVACGSSAPQMPTFLEWDQTVMQELGAGLADYISLHRYVGNADGDTADYLALSKSIDQQIESVNAAAVVASNIRRSPRRTYLCFDEWNVWYRARGGKYSDGRGQFAPPLLEEDYNFEDALVVAAFLMSFIRHADMVKIANLAQLVNVIAPIKTGPDGVLKQAIFDAFRMLSSRRGGVSLQQSIESESYDSASHGSVAYLDSAVTLDGRELTVFATNRHLDQPLQLSIQCADRTIGQFSSGEILSHSDVNAVNSWEEPNLVRSEQFDSVSIKQGKATIELPKHSFVAVTLLLS